MCLHCLCVCVMYKLMCLRRILCQELLVFLVRVVSKFPLLSCTLVLSAGVSLHDYNSTFSDASPYTHTHTHWCTVQNHSARVCLCASLRFAEVLPIAYMSAAVNCFSSAARLALLWLEIGVLTQRLEDGLYLMLASSSQ